MNKKMITTLLLSSLVASSLAIPASAATNKQVLKDEHGQLHDVVGKLGTVAGATAEERALNALDKVAGDFGFSHARGNFKLLNSHVDESGVTHTKLNHVINGIPVYGEQMIVHEANGDLQRVTGDFTALTPTATTASLSKNEAIAKATAYTGFTGKLSHPATAELAYFPQDGQAVLSYQVHVTYLGDQPGNWTIFVNAVDGSVVNAANVIENAVGTGYGVLGDTKKINTTFHPEDNLYYLEDHTKPMTGDIETYSYYNTTGTLYYMTDADNVWDRSDQRAGVDAHYYAGKVFDYYYGLGRNSLDGMGGSIYSAVHYSTGYNNAFYDGQMMVYGDGDGVTFCTMSAGYDVAAHELTHEVTQTTSNLTYSNQPGALNESWSDAQACVMDSGDWMIGEDIYTPATSGDALRYMDNPAKGNQPGTMSGYVTTTSDNGGVHTNSGIPNHAFYLFATGIGSRTIAGKVWYIASRDYMTSATNFSGARAATLAACAALYGSGSSYYTSLQNAWSSVGVN